MKRVNDKTDYLTAFRYPVRTEKQGPSSGSATGGCRLALTMLLMLVCSGLSLSPATAAPLGAELKFAVVGDLMGHDEQIKSAYDPECKCYDYASVFEDTAPIFKEADLAIGNLEVTLPGKPEKYNGYPLFGSPDAYAEAMCNAGFDILTLANNHTMDTGKEGVMRTHRVVQKLGMIGLGVYPDKKSREENSVPVIEKNGFRIAMLNYTYGTNGIPVPPGVQINHIHPARIRQDLKKASTMNVDLKMVFFHFGAEYTREPNNYQKQMVEVAVQAGADIVIGGHPHVLQPFEKRFVKGANGILRPVLIAYSLGNFVSHQIRRYTDGGMIFRFTVVQGEDGLVIKDVDYVPVLVYIDHSGKRPLYRVLPVEQYLYFQDGKLMRNPDAPRKLSKAGWSRMITFFQDTTEHLRKSRENAAP
ncbi:MAG TPA: capsule biosynthesis protein CapA [Leptospiraceae bacterium]|nr:capsule biosynthesis protein CapA [Spirochaetaceae bacterium]HBS03592.1 capsule biosynthesis protein CapA [Leptospiraceae bacterium]|tara:strand:+ start:89 stop:1336 length:1248 start_codon:yes stop_codon:yes gene_type:complete